MSRNYSLEDVETLRSKANISYEEAVSLLDKYDGDLARALIELEKRGQVGGERTEVKFDADELIGWIKKMWHKGMNTRLVIERKGETLINLPLLFPILMLVLGPYAVITAAVLVLVTGCSVSLKSKDKKPQTIIKGDASQAEAPADVEPALQPEESEQTDDDDFPSITIS